MDRKEDREILRKGGFAEGEMKRLSQLRRDYNERERLQTIAEHRLVDRRHGSTAREELARHEGRRLADHERPRRILGSAGGVEGGAR